MNSPEKMLRWFLRITALMLLSAAFAVVMPYSWMNTVHGWLGMGELPDTPLMGYLTRAVSAFCVLVGAWCWHVSCHIRRYLPLLRFAVPTTFVFSMAIIAIDLLVEMPLLWTACDVAFLLAWTLALWWLVRYR